VTSLGFLTFTFWNSYVWKLLRLETLTFSDVTLSDINVVWCYVLSQYLIFKYFDPYSKSDTGEGDYSIPFIFLHSSRYLTKKSVLLFQCYFSQNVVSTNTKSQMIRPLDDASPGQGLSWTRHPMDDASMVRPLDSASLRLCIHDSWVL